MRRAPYTMHGVLHFLQHEWSRYEMERANWEMERAELQVIYWITEANTLKKFCEKYKNYSRDP